MDSAVIFDVDGVLLDLTPAEEDAFFLPFERRYGLTGLSRDWDSYRIRNDEHIITEILERNALPQLDSVSVIADYLAILNSGTVEAKEIAGAKALLDTLSQRARLGIATANLLCAAKLRLQARGLWKPVRGLAFGADGSGHKRETVARAVSATGLPEHRIVYVGDNINDVEAGLANGVHFIGFSEDASRRAKLARAGARHISGDHAETSEIIAALFE